MNFYLFLFLFFKDRRPNGANGANAIELKEQVRRAGFVKIWDRHFVISVHQINITMWITLSSFGFPEYYRQYP